MDKQKKRKNKFKKGKIDKQTSKIQIILETEKLFTGAEMLLSFKEDFEICRGKPQCKYNFKYRGIQSEFWQLLF